MRLHGGFFYGTSVASLFIFRPVWGVLSYIFTFFGTGIRGGVIVYTSGFSSAYVPFRPHIGARQEKGVTLLSLL